MVVPLGKPKQSLKIRKRKKLSLQNLLISIFLIVFVLIWLIFGFIIVLNTQILTEDEFIKHGRYIYYSNTKDNNTLYRIPITRGPREKMNNSVSRYIVADMFNVYYTVVEAGSTAEEVGIYRSNVKDPKDKELLTNDIGNFLNVVNNHIIYSLDSELYSIDISSKDKLKLDIKTKGTITDIVTSNEYIYYISDSSINRVSLDSVEYMKLSEDDAASLTITEDWIFFINRSQKDSIYRMHHDGTERNFVCDNPGNHTSITAFEDWIYYVNSSDNHIYRIKDDGTEVMMVTNGKVNINTNFIIVYKMYVFYINENDYNTLSLVKLEGTDKRGRIIIQ